MHLLHPDLLKIRAIKDNGNDRKNTYWYLDHGFVGSETASKQPQFWLIIEHSTSTTNVIQINITECK